MKTKYYVVSEGELIKLEKEIIEAEYAGDVYDLHFKFLKSHKPVEEIYGGKFHHGDYLWRETVGYAELDKKLSDRNGKSIKIFIQECEK